MSVFRRGRSSLMVLLGLVACRAAPDDPDDPESVELEEHHVRLVHKQADADGDGYLTGSELRSHLEQLYHTALRKDVVSTLNLMDSNGDGKLSRAEFVAMIEDEAEKEHMMEQFNEADMDSNGWIDSDELLFSTAPQLSEQKTQASVEVMMYSLDGKSDEPDQALTIHELFSLYDPDGNEIPPQDDSQTVQFKKFDLNGDGKIDREELLKRAQRNMRLENDVDELMDETGASHRGLTPEHLVKDDAFDKFYRKTDLASLNAKPYKTKDEL